MRKLTITLLLIVGSFLCGYAQYWGGSSIQEKKVGTTQSNGNGSTDVYRYNEYGIKEKVGTIE